jgi:hypothetical protein
VFTRVNYTNLWGDKNKVLLLNASRVPDFFMVYLAAAKTVPWAKAVSTKLNRPYKATAKIRTRFVFIMDFNLCLL